MRKYYPGITLFKLAGALLVVLAHVMLFQVMGSLPQQQFQFALLPLRVVVPCFYVVSGFLAYQGWSHAANPRAYVRKYVVRISIIYAFFCLIFAAKFTLPALMHNGIGLGNLFLQVKILAVAVFLNGPYLQLWFIPPLLFSVLLCYWFYEKERLHAAVIVGFIGFVACQWVSGTLREVTASLFSYNLFPDSGYWYDLDSWITRYFGFGFTFVLAGVVLAKAEHRFTTFSPWMLWILAVGITLPETFLLLRYANWNDGYKLAFCLLPNTLLLFYGILHIKLHAVQKYHKFINLFSIVAFCGHIPFMGLNLYLFGWDRASMSGAEGVLYLFLTLAECLAVTVIWRYFAEPPKTVHISQ